MWVFERVAKRLKSYVLSIAVKAGGNGIYAEDPSHIVAGTMVRALPWHKALVRAWVSTTMAAINPRGRQSPRLPGKPRGYRGAGEG